MLIFISGIVLYMYLTGTLDGVLTKEVSFDKHAHTHTHTHTQIPISFALYLSLSVDNLDKTLDYSHHKTTMPQGAKVNDEADNSRAKVN